MNGRGLCLAALDPPGMLVLLDRGFHSARLIQLIRALQAHVLGRFASNVVPGYLRQLADGTYLAYLYPEDDSGQQRGRPCWCVSSNTPWMIPLDRVMATSIDW